MEHTSEQHLIRLAAEAFAVLTREQHAEMAESMDLTPEDVLALFEANEVRWEDLKDEIANPITPWNPPDSERMDMLDAGKVVELGKELGTWGQFKDCYWTCYELDGRFFIALCDSDMMWESDERTVTHLLKEG